MKKIKNLYKKIFVVFSLCIAFVCGLFLIDQNTYAYQTNNNFTNSITSIYYNNSSQNLEPFTTSSNNQWVRVSLNTNINSNYVLLLNVKYSFEGSINQSFLRYSTNGSNSGYSTRYIYNITNNSIKSIVVDLHSSTFQSDVNYLYFKIENSNVTFLNIDLVSSDDIYLSYYYDTYISNLESQLAELQDDYDSLQQEYSQLESDLNTLQQQYDDLQEEYNNLNESYNNLLQVQPFSDTNISSSSVKLNNVDLVYEQNDYIEFYGNYLYFDLYGSTWSNPLDVNYLVYTFDYSSTVFLGGFNGQVNLLHSNDDYMYFKFYLNGQLVGQSLDYDSNSNPINDIQEFTYNRMVITFVLHDINNLPSTYQGTLFSANNESYYNTGYQTGYDYAMSVAQQRILQYQSSMYALSLQLTQVRNELEEMTRLKTSYYNMWRQQVLENATKYNDGYRDGYDAGSDGNGSLYSMVVRNC